MARADPLHGSRMRIAVWHNLPSGGGKRALYSHVKGLVERGHQLEAWCPPTADRTYLPLGELIEEHVVPLDWQSGHYRGRIKRLLAPSRVMMHQIDAMDAHCRECADAINAGGFDLLFANSCTFFRVTSIGRHVKIPKVIYLQEPNRRLFEVTPKETWLAPARSNRSWWRRLRSHRAFLKDLIQLQASRLQAHAEVLNAESFDAILVNSLFSRESVLRAYGLDAKVCYLGIDTGLFAPKSSTEGHYIIGVGAFVREKNIGLVIEALGLLQEPKPPLVWVGNVSDKGYLDGLRRQALSRGVTFDARLRIADDELVSLLSGAIAMVYAPRLEPFGLAPLEANACGLPVIAVAEGGVRETVVDEVNGLLVESDPNALAEAVSRLMRDRDLARKLGENGRGIVQESWSLDACVDRLEYRLAQVIAARRPGQSEPTDLSSARALA
jgi:glycosyltransferase involved in cell wall biosynthesis